MDYQTIQPVLPKLGGGAAGAGRTRYLVAQSHQTSLLREQSRSSMGHQSKSQLRQNSKYFNQDLE